MLVSLEISNTVIQRAFSNRSVRGGVMLERRQSEIDQRSGRNRRRTLGFDYFRNGGAERRKGNERRSKLERRKDWLRVDKWVSILVYDLRWEA